MAGSSLIFRSEESPGSIEQGGSEIEPEATLGKCHRKQTTGIFDDELEHSGKGESVG